MLRTMTRVAHGGMDGSSADFFVPREREVGEDDLQIRAGGDMALLQAVSRRVLEAERAAPRHRRTPR